MREPDYKSTSLKDILLVYNVLRLWKSVILQNSRYKYYYQTHLKGSGSAPTVWIGPTSDQILKAKARKGEMTPEYPIVPSTILISVGFVWYGWLAQGKDPWIVPILWAATVGFGYLPIIMCTQNYLINTYEEFSALAVAASTILRSVMGACMPLAGCNMYVTMGYGWGHSLLAFIDLVSATHAVDIIYTWRRFEEEVHGKIMNVLGQT